MIPRSPQSISEFGCVLTHNGKSFTPSPGGAEPDRGGKHLRRRSLHFTSPLKVEVREEEIPSPGRGEVMVRTECSAISAGTEMLFYRDLVGSGTVLDPQIPSLSGDSRYPFKYGYSAVGRVIDLGEGVSPEWEGSRVFSFHPHESHFLARPEELLALPEGIGPEEGVFLPFMETALSLVMDGRPIMGEEVAVLGQGVIGLLTTRLLAEMPLSNLVTLEALEMRREWSREMGSRRTLDACHPTRELLSNLDEDGFDLVFEVSGNPQALDHAIRLTGFGGRVVIGSWYGRKKVPLHLGREFHRRRPSLVSSQVSSVDPSLSGRWDKRRRFQLAWRWIREVRPSRLITHRLPIGEAPRAYRMIHGERGKVLQVLLTYEEE